jgi:hypothetical protein
MKTKWFVIGLAVVGGAMAVMLLYRQPAPQVAQVVPVVKAPPATVQEIIPVEPVKEPQVQPELKAEPSPQKQAQTPGAKPPKEPLHDPDARDALALVGVDPTAEQYWLEAIYDSSLPDNEREDLMEDLNETGFADPKNLTANDLPLIMNRLFIIDSLLSDVDDFMLPHLQEAQKDLVNMAAKAAQ